MQGMFKKCTRVKTEIKVFQDIWPWYLSFHYSRSWQSSVRSSHREPHCLYIKDNHSLNWQESQCGGLAIEILIEISLVVIRHSLCWWQAIWCREWSRCTSMDASDSADFLPLCLTAPAIAATLSISTARGILEMGLWGICDFHGIYQFDV